MERYWSKTELTARRSSGKKVNLKTGKAGQQLRISNFRGKAGKKSPG